MLQLKTTTSRNGSGTELYVEFLNATGVYDAGTNPGGFGAPNPERNTLAVIFYGNFKLSTGDVIAVPVVYDPLTVSSFTILLDRSKNAHLNHYIFALPIFDDELEYEEGDIVFNNDNPSAPVIQKLNAEDEWDIIQPADLIAEEVDQKETNSFITPEAEAFENELAALRLSKLRALVNGSCGKDDYEPIRNAYDYIDGLLEGAILDFCSGAYAEAQLKLEEIFAYQDSYNAQQ
jgi:hypothetical protein